MRKLLCLILILWLVGCHEESIEGVWKDADGTTTISFENNQVLFFDVEGTYETNKNELVLTLNERKLVFQFELNDDELTLILDDSKLKMKRQ